MSSFISSSADEKRSPEQLEAVIRKDAPDLIPFLESVGPLQFLGIGRHRMTFAMPGRSVVLKVPIGRHGGFHQRPNVNEAKAYQGRRLDYPLAPCRLLANGCLVMRTVRRAESPFPSDFCPCVWCRSDPELKHRLAAQLREYRKSTPRKDRLPTWTFRVDYDSKGPQVGYLKSGKLVCFDFGENS